MSDVFADPVERRLLVADVAARRGIAEWVVEKDLWVCWVLARLQDLEGLPELTFKGGTSLSKVFGLVDRFSEDIDLTFSRAGWGYEGERDPLAPLLSGKARQKLVDELVERSVGLVRDLVVPGLRRAATQRLGETGWSVALEPDDAQAVRFVFPEPAAHYGYGLPAVKVEFGARGEPWPTERRLVRPYLEEEHPGTAESALVETITLRPERTFWEKATLLHALYHGTLAKPDKASDRSSRHLYDLHRLWQTSTLRPALLDPGLLDAVVRNKTVFFKEGKARYELITERKLSASPHPALEARLRTDFVAMQSMFFPGTPVPTFDELLGTLREIEALVASWERPASSPSA